MLLAGGNSTTGGAQTFNLGDAEGFNVLGDGSAQINFGSFTAFNILAAAMALVGNLQVQGNVDIPIAGTTLRPPRCTTVEKLAIASPGPGMMVFDTNLAKFSVYTGATWETVTSA